MVETVNLKPSETAHIVGLSLAHSTGWRKSTAAESARLPLKRPGANQPARHLLKPDRLKAFSPITSRPGTSFVQRSASNARHPTERLKAHTSTTMNRLRCAGFAARATFDGIRPTPRTPLIAFPFRAFTGQKAELMRSGNDGDAHG